MKKEIIVFLLFLTSCVSTKLVKTTQPFKISDRYEGNGPKRNPLFRGIPYLEDIYISSGEYFVSLTQSDQKFLRDIYDKYSGMEGQNNYVFPELKSGAHVIYSKFDSIGHLYIVMPPLYYYDILKGKFSMRLWVNYNENNKGFMIGSGDDLKITNDPIGILDKIFKGTYKK